MAPRLTPKLGASEIALINRVLHVETWIGTRGIEFSGIELSLTLTLAGDERADVPVCGVPGFNAVWIAITGRGSADTMRAETRVSGRICSTVGYLVVHNLR